MDIAHGYDRVDIICDLYFDNSLKNQTRHQRGQGTVLMFDENTKFPSDFKDNFLKNNNNKERLNQFLADKFAEIHNNGDITLTVTKGTGILTNDEMLSSDPLINYNTAEEADQKLVRHMVQCVKNGVKNVVIRTIDTDVLISLLAYRHFAGNFDSSSVYAWLATGKSPTFYDINKLAVHFGEKTCQALPFFYTFTGCDTVSSFFNQGKCKFWDRWQEFEDRDELTQLFCNLSKMPADISSEHIHRLEKYVLFVYYGKVDSPIDIDVQRMREFEYSTHNNIRLLPPSKLGLTEHIKRAAYEAGWVQYQCIKNMTLPNPNGWGWGLYNGKYSPTWQVTTEPIDEDLVITTCSCTTEKCLRCKCVTQKLQYIPFCKCHRRCLSVLLTFIISNKVHHFL